MRYCHGPAITFGCWLVEGDPQMRTLAIMALTLTLACCTGDRIKQGMNSPQEPFGMSVKSQPERNQSFNA
jgi:hypothetical protein